METPSRRKRRRIIATACLYGGVLAGVAVVHAVSGNNTGTPPGAFNPAVTQQTIDSTICVSGYTATIRPKLSSKPGYEHDHFIPLELGGAASDPKNLWFEKQPQAARTDVLETGLHRQVCAHTLTLKAAQEQIVLQKQQEK